MIRAHLARRFGHWLAHVFRPRLHDCFDGRNEKCSPEHCALGDVCPNRSTSYGELLTGDFGSTETAAGADPPLREPDDVCKQCGSPYFECETPTGTCGRKPTYKPTDERLSEIDKIPSHLSQCRHCRGLYRLLAQAYTSDRGASYDINCSQDLLCDSCGVTSCVDGCPCRDILCPHGRNNRRSK